MTISRSPHMEFAAYEKDTANLLSKYYISITHILCHMFLLFLTGIIYFAFHITGTPPKRKQQEVKQPYAS